MSLRQNNLKLNPEKTVVILVRKAVVLDGLNPLVVEEVELVLVIHVKSLEVLIDSDLLFEKQGDLVARSSFYELHLVC